MSAQGPFNFNYCDTEVFGLSPLVGGERGQFAQFVKLFTADLETLGTAGSLLKSPVTLSGLN